MSKHPFDPYHGLSRDELVANCIRLEEENKALRSRPTWRGWLASIGAWLAFQIDDLAKL